MRGNLLLTALAAAGRALEREGGAYALYIEGLSIRAVSVASERGTPSLGTGACPGEGDDDNDTDSAARRLDGNPED